MTRVGLESIGFYTSNYFLDLRTLAEMRGLDPRKFYIGLGQEKMSVTPPDEDVVTMGANAARSALRDAAADRVDTLLFATESGVDQSKAAGLYLHGLLELPKACRVVELKQACYSTTAAIQFAVALVQQNPARKVLVIASDVARYGLGTAAEATQGCGAIALVVSAEPRLMTFDPEYGVYAEDIMDFWRPNYRDEAVVDGHYSTRMYLNTLTDTWSRYSESSGRSFGDIDHFCYHLPFTRMAEKAHVRLAKHCGVTHLPGETLIRQIEHSLHYNRVTGNSYAASLYIGLSSLLDRSPSDLSGHRVGLFSYGSGCVAEFYSGVVLPEYRSARRADEHAALLDDREELDYERYEEFYRFEYPRDGGDHACPRHRTGYYRLSGFSGHKRIYERTS